MPVLLPVNTPLFEHNNFSDFCLAIQFGLHQALDLPIITPYLMVAAIIIACVIGDGHEIAQIRVYCT